MKSISALFFASVACAGTLSPRQVQETNLDGPFDLFVMAALDPLTLNSYITATNLQNAAVHGTNMAWRATPWQPNMPKFFFDRSNGSLRLRGNDTTGSPFDMVSSFAPGSARGDLWPLMFSNTGTTGFTQMNQFAFDTQTNLMAVWGDMYFWACMPAGARGGPPQIYHTQNRTADAPGCWQIGLTRNKATGMAPGV